MWECVNCREQIEDKYKHCWNCGGPKPEAAPLAPPPEILQADAEKPPPAEEVRSENVSPEAVIPPVKEIPANEKIPPREDLLFDTTFPYKEKSESKIGKIVPLGLWLAAFIAVAAFTYYSYDKTKTFENRIAEDAVNLGAQTNQFAFTPTTTREKKSAAKEKALPLKVQAKVLPLNAQTKEIDGLYNFLPDDLRPANLEEVKTLLWLDCKPSEAGSYEDGSPAFQDRCNGYLVDRNTAKVVQVQDFLGELPPLKKQWGTSYASGKVLPETYISYIKANQPENEKTADRFATDSPNHHFWLKSELLYSSILLILLAAIGIGWLIYKLKSISWKPE